MDQKLGWAFARRWVLSYSGHYKDCTMHATKLEHTFISFLSPDHCYENQY